MIGAWQGKEALGTQRRSLHAHLGGGVEDHVGDQVAVAEMVVGRDGHAVAQAGLLERGRAATATTLLPSAG